MRELNFENKLVSFNYKEWIEHFAEGDECYPQIIELDPTSKCMYSCDCCVNSDIINKTEPIKREDLLQLIDDFYQYGGKGIIFIGGGEPLMYPQIGDIFKYVYNKGIKIGITTNGFLIDKYLTEIADYSQWTRVSMDAATEEMYKKVRPCKDNTAYKRVLENCRKLVEIKKGVLGFSFLIIDSESYSNVHEIYSAAYLAKQIGFDYFEVKPMVDKNHFLFHYSDYVLNSIFEQLDRALQLNDSTFEVIYPDSLFQYKRETLVQMKDYTECPVMKLRCVVTNHGIYPCPYKRGYQKYNMGSISNGYKNFVNGEEYKKALKHLNPQVECQFYCIRNDINKMLNMLKNGHLDCRKLKYIDNKDVFV